MQPPELNKIDNLLFILIDLFIDKLSEIKAF